VSKKKLVSLQPTTEQALRLELMQMRCHLNLEAQSHMDALRLFWDNQISLFRLALYVAETNKPSIEKELAQRQAEGKELLQEACKRLEERLPMPCIQPHALVGNS
jgi:hypothetical protein